MEIVINLLSDIIPDFNYIMIIFLSRKLNAQGNYS